MTALFPRLDNLAVDSCLARFAELVAAAARPLSEERLPATTGWTAAGGSKVSLATIDGLRMAIVDVARAHGFPDRGSVSDRSNFDADATAVLADFQPLASGEGDRDAVWAFIATVLLPDVVAWRFVNQSPERFEGGVRNAFQRLWMRAQALDRGVAAGDARWELVSNLTEDALVQITERPSIGADPRLSRAIGEAWIRTSRLVGASRMEDVMRKAIIDLRIRNEIQMLTSLGDDELQAMIDEFFERTAGRPRDDENSAPPVPSKVVATRANLRTTASSLPAADRPTFPLSAMPSVASPAITRPRIVVIGTGEADIQTAILELMSDGAEWSNARLKDHLRTILPLTEADRGVGARTAEELWENRVNNALSHARASSLYAKGLVEKRGHGIHAITAAGRRLIGAADDDVLELVNCLKGQGKGEPAASLPSD